MNGKEEGRSLKVCVVTGIPPLNLLVFRFVQVLEPIVDELVLITGNYPEKDVFSPKIRLINIASYNKKIANDNKKQPFFIRILKFILLQLKFTWYLVKNMPQTKIIFFFLEGRTFLLPILVARLAGKKPIIVVTHSSSQISRQTNKNSFLTLILLFLERINNGLAKKMIVYSPNVCRLFNLEKYNDKIIIAHEQFINVNLFNVQYPLEKRGRVVGYIGRFSKEKGILNFIDALPLISEDEISFLIIGDGELREEVEGFINQKNLHEKVQLLDWVPNEKLPNYLNTMQLIVIPSYTESGPIIALEAMACGTPILARRVGHVLNMIEDGENGFIMEDNSPECIARNIMRALTHPNLDEIAQSARAVVEKEYTFEAAVERYRGVLSSLKISASEKRTAFRKDK